DPFRAGAEGRNDGPTFEHEAGSVFAAGRDGDEVIAGIHAIEPDSLSPLSQGEDVRPGTSWVDANAEPHSEQPIHAGLATRRSRADPQLALTGFDRTESGPRPTRLLGWTMKVYVAPAVSLVK